MLVLIGLDLFCTGISKRLSGPDWSFHFLTILGPVLILVLPKKEKRLDRTGLDLKTLRAGSIEVDYQTELQQLVTGVFIQVWGVIRFGVI